MRKKSKKGKFDWTNWRGKVEVLGNWKLEKLKVMADEEGKSWLGMGLDLRMFEKDYESPLGKCSGGLLGVPHQNVSE